MSIAHFEGFVADKIWPSAKRFVLTCDVAGSVPGGGGCLLTSVASGPTAVASCGVGTGTVLTPNPLELAWWARMRVLRL